MERKTKSESRIITIPNILSAFRICLIPVIVWLYLAEQQYRYAGYVLILSAATDIVVGYIARHYHMISTLGKIFGSGCRQIDAGGCAYMSYVSFSTGTYASYLACGGRDFYRSMRLYCHSQNRPCVLALEPTGMVKRRLVLSSA